MPNPDDARHILSIEDFLCSINEQQQQRIYASLLAPLEPLARRIKATWRAPDGMPDIRIVKNARAEETELRDIVNTVCIAEGLLGRCLNANARAVEIMGPSKLPNTLGSLSIAKLGMMWSCAHEIFHFLRRHELVETHFGNDPATKHALEYDADLCAVAAIYRYLRHFSPNKSALHVKLIVLQHLFWPLRLEVERTIKSHFDGSQTHPHAAARMLDIVGKLAVMHDTNVADPNFSNPLSHLHHHRLVTLMALREVEYMKAVCKEPQSQYSPVADFANKNVGLTYTSDRHQRWDEISQLIDKFAGLPRSMVTNDSSIAFIGEVISMPRGAR